MRITIIGCGNAFSKRNFNQSFVLEQDGKRMLIDCGRLVPEALTNAGLSFKDIDSVYISHQHNDHCGSLENFAFDRYDWMNRPVRWNDFTQLENIGKMKPYAPKLYAQKELIKSLWKNTLRGGLESMEGFDATIETYFEPKPVDKSFIWQGWNFELIQQVHIMTGSKISDTFGLIVSKQGHQSIYFTTDSQHCSPKQVRVFYSKADIIIQDCECLPFKSGVHANYTELAGYPEANAEVLPLEIKNKMWLSHYQDYVLDDKDFFGKPCDWKTKAKDDGFRGFLEVGQTFDI